MFTHFHEYFECLLWCFMKDIKKDGGFTCNDCIDFERPGMCQLYCLKGGRRTHNEVHQVK